MLSVVMLSAKYIKHNEVFFMLSVIILNNYTDNVECHIAECHSPECHYAECHYARCHYACYRYTQCQYDNCHYTQSL
jgi:hypothetical protein